MTPGGYYYAANNFFTSEHGGTHLDAPVHFAQNQWSVDQVPLDRLIGSAVVVDVVASSERNPDYQVSVGDLEAWEKAHGAIPANAMLLIKTGFSTRWPDAARYLGTAERGQDAVAKLHFPGLHPDAARWLVANRSITALGIDTASIDFGQSTAYESHQVLYARNIPAFENLDQPHAAAGDRGHGHRAADEDRGREWRSFEGGGGAAALTCGHNPLPMTDRPIDRLLGDWEIWRLSESIG